MEVCFTKKNILSRKEKSSTNFPTSDENARTQFYHPVLSDKLLLLLFFMYTCNLKANTYVCLLQVQSNNLLDRYLLH